MESANVHCSEESGRWAETRGRYTRSVTVVLCTRDRPALLRTALESILAVDYSEFDIIVVDNAPESDATRQYVMGLSDPRVRVIDEPRPGLSRARNTGLSAATGDIVAFTDDDVVVDRYWLRALLDGFDRGTSVSCVSGIVPAGEIRTPAQAFFDRRVGWSEFTDPCVFDWGHPPRDIPLFPFAVRRYGTGANFAVERDVVLRLGGFDEALGAGTAVGGGEDIDMFFRILRSGRQLVHDPAAIVWHRHRTDSEGLLAQTRGYGLGLGAWLAKITGDPGTASLAIKTAVHHAPAFVRHMHAASTESAPPDNLAAHLPPGIADDNVEVHRQRNEDISFGATRWGFASMNPVRSPLIPRDIAVEPAAERNLRTNTVSLIAANLATGVLGLVYWVAAGRLYPEREVGVAAALINSAVMLSTLSLLSIGTSYERFLPLAGTRAGPLLRKGFLVVAATAIVFGLALIAFGPRHNELFQTSWGMVIYPLLVMVLAVFTLQDRATVGLGVARWSAAKNSSHAVAKLIVLVALAWTGSAVSIVAAWGVTAAAIAAYVVVASTPPVSHASPISGTTDPAVSPRALVLLGFVIRYQLGLGDRALSWCRSSCSLSSALRQTRTSPSPGRSSAGCT